MPPGTLTIGRSNPAVAAPNRPNPFSSQKTMEPESHSRLHRLGAFLKDKFLNAGICLSAAIASRQDAFGFGRKGKIFAAIAVGLLASSCYATAPPREENADAGEPRDGVVLPGGSDTTTLPQFPETDANTDTGTGSRPPGTDADTDTLSPRWPSDTSTDTPTFPQGMDTGTNAGTSSSGGGDTATASSPPTSMDTGTVPQSPETDADTDTGVVPGPPGTLAWARSVSGVSKSEAISSMNDGSFVIAGSFWNMVTFGKGEPNESAIDSTDGSSESDMFVAKYNPDGTFAWVRHAGSTGDDGAEAVVSLPDGSAVVVGTFGVGFYNGPIVFEQGEPTEVALGPVREPEDYTGGSFIAKYESDGTLAWARANGGTCRDVSALPDGSVVTTGVFFATEEAIFGPGEPNETVLTNEDGDFFIAKYNPAGELDWVKCAGTTDADAYLPYFDQSSAIGSLPDGSLMISGTFDEGIIFGRGEPNETTLSGEGSFISKYSPDGHFTWVRTNTAQYPYDLAVFPDDSVVMAGIIGEQAIFGGGEPEETTLSTTPDDTTTDTFIARYSPDGTLAWARKAGSGGLDRAYGVAAFADGSSVMTGFFRGKILFGEGSASEVTFASAECNDESGCGDVFVARYNPDGGLLWAVREGAESYDYGKAVAALPDGSTIVTGFFASTVVFGEGTPNETELRAVGSSIELSIDWNAFVAKYY